MESMRNNLKRIIKSNGRLVKLEKERHIVARRVEAYNIIKTIIPGASDDDPDKAQVDNAKRAILMDFFSSTSKSWSTYANEKKLDVKIRGIVGRIIENDSSLSQFVKKRAGPKRFKGAFEVINALFPATSSEDQTAIAERAKQEREMKIALVEFFSDSSGTSIKTFCEQYSYDDSLRYMMYRFLDRSARLGQLVDQRDNADRREEALGHIEQLLPHVKIPYLIKPPGQAHGSSSAENEEDSGKTKNAKKEGSRTDFFHPDNIQMVASQLDYGARPRMSRDGSKVIEVHDRKAPSELLIFSVLDLTNRVVKGRALSQKEREEVLQNCAKILCYDQ